MEIIEIDQVLVKYIRFCQEMLGKTYKRLKTPFSCLTPHKIYLFTLSEVEKVKVFLNQFEEYFLKQDISSSGQKTIIYLVDPDIMTIADIYIICDLCNLRVLGIKLEDYKKVYGYIQRYFNNNVFMAAHTDFLLFCATRGENLEQNFGYNETQKKKEMKKIDQD